MDTSILECLVDKKKRQKLQAIVDSINKSYTLVKAEPIHPHAVKGQVALWWGTIPVKDPSVKIDLERLLEAMTCSERSRTKGGKRCSVMTVSKSTEQMTRNNLAQNAVGRERF